MRDAVKAEYFGHDVSSLTSDLRDQDRKRKNALDLSLEAFLIGLEYRSSTTSRFPFLRIAKYAEEIRKRVADIYSTNYYL